MKLSDLLSEVAMEYLAHPETDQTIPYQDGHLVVNLYVQLINGISENMAVQIASIDTSKVEDELDQRGIWLGLSIGLVEQLQGPEAPRAFMRLPEATKQ